MSINIKGYLTITNYLDEKEFSDLTQLANWLQNCDEVIGGPMKYFERVGVNKIEKLNRVEKFLEDSLILQQLIEVKIKPLLKNITDDEYLLLKEKINFKMPLAGGFKPHQDAPAFTKFVKSPMLIFMIPLQETNELNGFLQVSNDYFEESPIQHQNGQIPPDRLKNINWVGIKQKEKDILIFNSYLIHKSDLNNSSLPRRCFYLTFNLLEEGNLRENYFKFKRENFPPRVERSIHNCFKNWQANLAREIY